MRIYCILKLIFILSVFQIILAENDPITSKLQSTRIEDKAVFTTEERQSTKEDDEAGPDYRLPSSLLPLHYFLKIRPIIDKDHPGVGDKDTASGYVRILVKSLEQTRKIVMHQKSLKINETFIGVKNLENGESIGVSSVEYNLPRDFIIINLNKELRPPNEYEISIDYWAKVPPNDTLKGLYSESYLDPLTNQTKVVAVTQLEALRARQVFPSFDEPTFKTPFDVVIGRTENFTALANGPLIGTKPDILNPGWFWDTFNTTVPMSTYLLSIGIADYGFNEASSDLYRLPVRVHGPRHLTNEGKAQLTADGSAMLMDYFEKKYGVPHGMPKVDSISVPYKGGAMENYGLITYGEYLLMYYEGITLDTDLREILYVLAHELGHQWFGNMVTCHWWSDIWLNEGFATYVGYDGMHAIWPQFEITTFRIHEMVNEALKYDATAASHPIHQETFGIEHIRRNFDTIGYSKGGSIVNLMVSFLGDDIFHQGIHHYLDKHQDSVAKQDDLFKALNHIAISNGISLPKNVTEIMHTWTLQNGFPLVRVHLIKDNNSFVFTQEPWQNAVDRNNKSIIVPESTWNIPIKYLLQIGDDVGREGKLWLLEDGAFEVITIPRGSGWVMTNPDAGGYYRTLYDKALVDKIIDQLERNHETFPVAGRIRLLDDQLTLGFEKYVPIQDALEFTKYLRHETDPTVWSTAFSNLLKLRMLWGAYTVKDSFNVLKKYLLPRVEGARMKVSNLLELESFPQASAKSILYSELVDWSCALNSEWCGEYASQLFNVWRISPKINPVPVNLQSILYCKIVEIEGKRGYDWILRQYQQPEQTTSQKARMASALGCVTNHTLDAMLLGLKRQGIDADDSISLLRSVLKHTAHGRYHTLVYMQWADKWIRDFGWTAKELTKVISVGKYYFSMDDEAKAVETVLLHSLDTFGDTLNSTIDKIRENSEWTKDFTFNITSWFDLNS